MLETFLQYHQLELAIRFQAKVASRSRIEIPIECMSRIFPPLFMSLMKVIQSKKSLPKDLQDTELRRLHETPFETDLCEAAADLGRLMESPGSIDNVLDFFADLEFVITDLIMRMGGNYDPAELRVLHYHLNIASTEAVIGFLALREIRLEHDLFRVISMQGYSLTEELLDKIRELVHRTERRASRNVREWGDEEYEEESRDTPSAPEIVN